MEESERILLSNQFLQFLENSSFNYVEKIKDLLETNTRRLIIDINDLWKHNASLAKMAIERPSDVLPLFCEATKRFAAQENEGKLDLKEEKFFVGFVGSFGRLHVSPRELESSLLARMVAVRGIVTKCSLVLPRLLKAVQFCEATGERSFEIFSDPSDPNCSMSTFRRPKTKDDKGNPLSFEYGECTFKDHQSAILQELPEHAPAGQLPRSVKLVIDEDLVDSVKPGDRIQAVGVFQVIEHDDSFPTFVVVNSITKIQNGPDESLFSSQDIENIKEVAKVSPFERLTHSLAPSIFGHEMIKRAMLLQMLGGVEKTTTAGMHLRGDIHVLLVGDPSTAKSQLLRYVLSVAPLAISANGRGASGVGLTAAVTQDRESRERVLEAGAMVLADRGIVCIDEFDKMDTNDRAAMHEVMEQQTVTVQKAGVHTALNARCSVFAAANPLFGNYNREKSPTENIGFPDSLLSRFDLLFIVLDNMDMKSDRTLSEHVLRMHRYVSPAQSVISKLGKSKGIRLEELALTEAKSNSNNDTSEVFNREEKLFFGTNATLFSTPFMRKYIDYARRLVRPVLTSECCSVLSDAYGRMRANASFGTLPITARALDSLVRLSEAHARCRLSRTVDVEDANVAIELMRFSLYDETTTSTIVAAVPTNLGSKRKNNPVSDSSEQRPEKQPRIGTPNASIEATNTESEFYETQDIEEETQSTQVLNSESATQLLSDPLETEQQKKTVKQTVALLLQRESTVGLEELMYSCGKDIEKQVVETALRELERENLITYDEEVVYGNS